MEGEALSALGEVGAKGSLRYAVQMLTPARILAETYGRDKVRDVMRCDAMLWWCDAMRCGVGERGWVGNGDSTTMELMCVWSIPTRTSASCRRVVVSSSRWSLPFFRCSF